MKCSSLWYHLCGGDCSKFLPLSINHWTVVSLSYYNLYLFGATNTWGDHVQKLIILGRYYHQAGRAFAHGISYTADFNIAYTRTYFYSRPCRPLIHPSLRSSLNLYMYVKHTVVAREEQLGCETHHILGSVHFKSKAIAISYSVLLAYRIQHMLPLSWLQILMNQWLWSL